MIAPASAGPLRTKAGKTMPGCAAVGLLETLPEVQAIVRQMEATGPCPGFTCFAAQWPMSAKKRSG